MLRNNKISTPTPRKLFRGAFQPDLETALAGEIAAVKTAHGPLAPVTVVAPTRLLGLHLQRALPFPHANVRFQTLTDLLPSHQSAPLTLELLCRQIALTCTGYFAPVRDTPGFATALLATFTDLQEAGRTTFSGTTAKHRELATAYRAFCDWLAQHDPAGQFAPLPPINVFLYGCYDLNLVQRQFIERLAPAAIFFPATAHAAYAQPLLDWFHSLGYRPVAAEISNQKSQITVTAAPGETAEVREAVRAIFAYLRANPGQTFADCAILCRQRDQYDAILRDTLPTLGVRAFFRGGRPLSEHPAAKRFCLLLETIRSDFSRAAVMELAGHIGATGPWETLTVKLGIVGGKLQWRDRLQRAADQTGPLTNFVEQLFAATDALPRQGSWRQFVDVILTAFRQLGGESAPVIAAIEALAELDAVQTPVSFDTFAEFAGKALDAGRDQPEKLQGGVFVSDVMGARGLRFGFGAVLGLVEKSFPRVIREDPLLLDAERAPLQLPLKGRGSDEERLLFDLACGCARDQLVLSYPSHDPATARPRTKSFLLPELEPVPPPKTPALDEREFDLAALGVTAAADYLAGIAPLAAAGVAAESCRWREPALTKYDGRIESPAALQLLQDRFGLEKLVSSATALEDFFGCPFYYFQKHVLRIEEWDEPEEAISIDPLDLGALYHKILEDYYRRGTLAVIDEHLQQFERTGVTGYPAVWEIKKEIIRHELGAFVAREQRRLGAVWQPREFEKPFNGIAVAPPVRLRGKIDRIDFSPDGRQARVLDYKTGQVPAGQHDDSLARGTALQLPLYLLAAEQLLTGVTVEQASYLYFTLRGRYREISFSRAALVAQRGALTGMLQTAAEMIRAGVFTQFATEANCRDCQFRVICGNGIIKLAERKAADPRQAGFRAIQEASP